MRNYIKLFIVGLVVVASSCNKYLDVNDVNPNAPQDVTPDLLLPAALSQTANTSVTFNSYGAWAGGYQANAGGYGGFGADITYNYSTSNYNALWSQSYSNINDYQTIINKTNGTGPYKGYYAIAKIMKAYVFIKLIDVYGDVPYTFAAQGLQNLTPKYDKAEDIYKALFTELDQAITAINLTNSTASTIKTTTSANSQKIDIVDALTSYNAGGANTAGSNFSDAAGGYPGQKWVAFANTLKLKMLVRARAVPSMSATVSAEAAKIQSANFVTYDVVVQPGYAAQSGKQNPAWNAYAYDGTGTASQLTTVPTFYAVGFYDGHKLLDAGRGTGVTYKSFVTANQLGIQNQFVETSPNGTNWYVGTASGTSGDAIGILKGPTMAQPLMLAAESYFLRAEAALYGLIPGNVVTLFENGVKSSYNYLYLRKEGTLDASRNVETAFAKYKTDNATTNSYLVNVTPALSQDQTLEAIITQKWLAVNYIHSNEGWSDYRRTGYPRTTGTDPYTSFASTQSVSTRPDRLPVRVLYPITEYSLNASNVPQGINVFTSRIFYDLN